MKGKLPFYSIKERMQKLSKEYPLARIIEGDKEQDTWTPIINNMPEVIVCGYDQTDLFNALSKVSEKYNFELIQITENHKGEELHSRIINKSV
jgi:glycerol-3-phosphate cytidylyltransferase-like family protein